MKHRLEKRDDVKRVFVDYPQFGRKCTSYISFQVRLRRETEGEVRKKQRREGWYEKVREEKRQGV